MNLTELKANKNERFLSGSGRRIWRYSDVMNIIEEKVGLFLVNGKPSDVENHINEYLGSWKVIPNYVLGVKTAMDLLFPREKKT